MQWGGYIANYAYSTRKNRIVYYLVRAAPVSETAAAVAALWYHDAGDGSSGR